MDHLKEGIGLRGYGQKNPLHEYQREAYVMFSSMMHAVKTAILQNLFIPELPSEAEIEEIEEREREMQRRREAQARTIHEEVIESTAEEASAAAAAAAAQEGLNRKQRRDQQTASQAKVANYTPSQSDYAPTGVAQDAATKARKDQQRKKNKAAKKDRKKGR